MNASSFPKFIFVFFIVSVSSSQPRSTAIYLSDWGIDSISSIRMGQCSVIDHQGEIELKIESLYDESVFAAAAADTSQVLRVADFNGQFINLLGGSSSTYAGNGATAEARHTISLDRVEAVAVSYNKSANGYCGFWMHLFNSAAPRNLRRYLDAVPYEYLIFAVRGASGGERVGLKIADEAWNEKEDAMAIGEFGQYVPAGHITTAWQIARVPLRSISSGLDRRKLASLVFEALSPSRGTFEIGPISCAHNSESVPFLQHRDRASSSSLERALWVWDTEAILKHKGEDSLLQFLRLERFNNVFLALPYDPLKPSVEWGITLDTTTLGPLLQKLNAAGIKVHALTGDREFILPGKKEFVRNTINNIVRYNKSVPPDRQFFAIHLDVEPYLVPGFNSPARLWYLGNFLDIMKECSEIAHNGKIQIGADVPPWYDSADELTHQHIMKDSKPLYQQLIDMLDNITLMDYRTTVEGDDGIVMFAVKELEYAEEHGKKIFVGLETSFLPDETILTFREPLTKGIPQRAPVIIITTKNEYQTEFTHIPTENDLNGWLREKKNREGMYYWPIVSSTNVPSSRSTFAKLGRQQLEETLQKAEPALRNYRSFAGYAIHWYRSYSEMGR